MQFVSFTAGSTAGFGILTEAGIVDLSRRLGLDSLHELIASGRGDEARAFASDAPDHTDFVLQKPLDRWGKCFCVGVNYPDRNAEYKDDSDLPKYPSLFVRFADSFTGPDMPLIRPPESLQLDYEGEVVIVIGRFGRRIPAERWTEYVFGYTVANEGSIRDWIRHGKFNVTPGKNWPGSGSIGPSITTADSVDPLALRVVTRVNGEERQNDTTDRLIFSFGRILEYISTFCTLQPGDIILTGTPTGAGARFNPPRYLEPGDEVQVEVAGLGLLRNTVADERIGP